jgi:hypothetical protein
VLFPVQEVSSSTKTHISVGLRSENRGYELRVESMNNCTELYGDYDDVYYSRCETVRDRMNTWKRRYDATLNMYPKVRGLDFGPLEPPAVGDLVEHPSDANMDWETSTLAPEDGNYDEENVENENQDSETETVRYSRG